MEGVCDGVEILMWGRHEKMEEATTCMVKERGMGRVVYSDGSQKETYMLLSTNNRRNTKAQD